MAPFQQLVEEANIAWDFTYRGFTRKIIKPLSTSMSEDRVVLSIFFTIATLVPFSFFTVASSLEAGPSWQMFS